MKTFDVLKNSDLAGDLPSQGYAPKNRKGSRCCFLFALLMGATFVVPKAEAYIRVDAKTFQSDGSAADTRAAIVAASIDDTIIVPNGTYTWGSLSVDKAVHLKAQTPRGVTIYASPSIASGGLISIIKQNAGNVRVSGFILRPPNPPLGASQYQSFLMHCSGTGSEPPVVQDCDFHGDGRFCFYTINWRVNGGVLAGCRFYTTYPHVAGIQMVLSEQDGNASWSSPSTMGMNDPSGKLNTYIEDCTFNLGYNGMCNPEDGARVVLRRSTITNGALANHGADTGPIGARHMEYYDNTFVYDPATDFQGGGGMNTWFYIRGGTGVIADNHIPDIPGGKVEVIFTVQNIRRAAGPYSCWTTYPVPKQIGQGYGPPNALNPNGPIDFSNYRWITKTWNVPSPYSLYLEPFYVWGNAPGNQNPSLLDYFGPTGQAECNPNLHTASFIQNGRDYIMGVKPGYTKYTYPHPLRNVVPNTTPPSVAVNPVNVAVTVGQQANFSVVATGGGAITYQWQKNGSNIPGATSSSLALSSVQFTDGGTFRCVVSSPYGSVTSAAATLTVSEPVPVRASITTHPVNLTRTVGESAAFTVAAIGDAPLVYQWQKDGVNIPGATSASYLMSNVQRTDAGGFRCVVGNALGSEISGVATLTVNAVPVGSIHYVDATAGDDSNPGTAESPWRRCPGMVGWTGSAELQPGAVVYFDRSDTWDLAGNANGSGIDMKPGVHYIGDEWPGSSGAGRRAQLRAVGRHEAGVVRFLEDHATHSTWFEGFEVNGNGHRANLIDINHAFWRTGLTKATKRIQDCVVHNNSGNGTENDYKYGIIVSDPSPDGSGWVANVEILDTVVHNVARDGICAYPTDNGMASNIVVRGCEVYNTGNDPSYTEGHGLLIKGNVKNSVFEFCYAHDVNASALLIGGPERGSGPGPTGCAARFNVLQSIDDNGVIRVSGPGIKNFDLYGNLVLENEATGGLSFAGNAGSITAQVFNNTFHNAYVNIGDPSSTGTIEFRNNLIYELDDAPLTDLGGDLTGHSHNLYFRVGGGVLVQSGGLSYTASTLAGYETGALSADPRFKNRALLPSGFAGVYGATLAPNSDGLSLLSGSPAINTGTALGTSGSINSAARPSGVGWDIGAYEFVGALSQRPSRTQNLRIVE